MKFLAQRNIRDVAGFDVMLLQPVKIQANVIVHIKVTMTGNLLHCGGGCMTGVCVNLTELDRGKTGQQKQMVLLSILSNCQIF